MSYTQISNIPCSAKAKYIAILKPRDEGFLELEITVYKTGRNSFLRISSNSLQYVNYKFDTEGYSDSRLIDLLKMEFGISYIPKRNFPYYISFSDSLKYCFKTIVRTISDEKHYPEENYLMEFIEL